MIKKKLHINEPSSDGVESGCGRMWCEGYLQITLALIIHCLSL